MRRLTLIMLPFLVLASACGTRPFQDELAELHALINANSADEMRIETEEIEEISNAIRREGELEQKKIIESAKEMAIKIEKDAENAAALEIAKARTELQREAVQLAVELAEDLLKKNFTKEDDARLIDEYIQKVGELH